MSSPQRRLTSVFDLANARWAPIVLTLSFRVQARSTAAKRINSRIKQSIDHKTLLAVTNAAVEPPLILAVSATSVE
jgi:hypothetical protein